MRVEKNGRCNVFRAFCVGAAVVMVLAFSGVACAAVRDKIIEEVPGLWYENVVYAWNRVAVDIVNTTKENLIFGGTMVFLDRRGKQVARASLLPRKVAGLTSERYIAYLVEGSGEAARHAKRVIWDFGIR